MVPDAETQCVVVAAIVPSSEPGERLQKQHFQKGLQDRPVEQGQLVAPAVVAILLALCENVAFAQVGEEASDGRKAVVGSRTQTTRI